MSGSPQILRDAVSRVRRRYLTSTVTVRVVARAEERLPETQLHIQAAAPQLVVTDWPNGEEERAMLRTLVVNAPCTVVLWGGYSPSAPPELARSPTGLGGADAPPPPKEGAAAFASPSAFATPVSDAAASAALPPSSPLSPLAASSSSPQPAAGHPLATPPPLPPAPPPDAQLLLLRRPADEGVGAEASGELEGEEIPESSGRRRHWPLAAGGGEAAGGGGPPAADDASSTGAGEDGEEEVEAPEELLNWAEGDLGGRRGGESQNAGYSNQPQQQLQAVEEAAGAGGSPAGSSGAASAGGGDGEGAPPRRREWSLTKLPPADRRGGARWPARLRRLLTDEAYQDALAEALTDDAWALAALLRGRARRALRWCCCRRRAGDCAAAGGFDEGEEEEEDEELRERERDVIAKEAAEHMSGGILSAAGGGGPVASAAQAQIVTAESMAMSAAAALSPKFSKLIVCGWPSGQAQCAELVRRVKSLIIHPLFPLLASLTAAARLAVLFLVCMCPQMRFVHDVERRAIVLERQRSVLSGGAPQAAGPHAPLRAATIALFGHYGGAGGAGSSGPPPPPSAFAGRRHGHRELFRSRTLFEPALRAAAASEGGAKSPPGAPGAPDSLTMVPLAELREEILPSGPSVRRVRVVSDPLSRVARGRLWTGGDVQKTQRGDPPCACSSRARDDARRSPWTSRMGASASPCPLRSGPAPAGRGSGGGKTGGLPWSAAPAARLRSSAAVGAAAATRAETPWGRRCRCGPPRAGRAGAACARPGRAAAAVRG